MPKRAKAKNWKKPPMLDIQVPGLNLPKPRPDQFRVSSEVMTRAGVDGMRAMVKDLAARGELDLLRARVARRITSIQLFQAYREVGNSSLASLKAELSVTQSLLAPMVEAWANQLTSKDKYKTETQLRRFIAWLAETKGARAIDSVTDANINEFLKGLTSLRGRARNEANVQTRDRYRAAICGFCTYLVDRGIIKFHPIKDGNVPLWDRNPDHRLPHASREDYSAYFRGVSQMRPDLPPDQAHSLREACTIFLRLLWHTGGDVSEVRKLIVADVSWPERNAHEPRPLCTIRLKRTKVRSKPRLVPYPPEHVAELRAFIKSRELKHNDSIFGCLRQVISKTSSYLPDIRTAHEKAVKEMGRYIRIKDLRHLAAISWAKSDVRIEQIRKWLGHSSIDQTTVYSDFIPTHGEIFDKISSAARVDL